MGEFAAGLAQGLGQGTASLPQAVGFREERKLKGEQIALTKQKAESERASKAIVGQLAQAGIDPADRAAVLDFLQTQTGGDPAALADALSLAANQGLIAAQTKNIEAGAEFKGAQTEATKEATTTEKLLRGRKAQKLGAETAFTERRTQAIGENLELQEDRLALDKERVQNELRQKVLDRVHQERLAKIRGKTGVEVARVQGEESRKTGEQRFQQNRVLQMEAVLQDIVKRGVLGKLELANTLASNAAVTKLRTEASALDKLLTETVRRGQTDQATVSEIRTRMQAILDASDIYESARDLAVFHADESGDAGPLTAISTIFKGIADGTTDPEEGQKALLGVANSLLQGEKKPGLTKKVKETTKTPFDLRVGAPPEIPVDAREFAQRMVATYPEAKKGSLAAEKVFQRAFEKGGGDPQKVAEILSEDQGVKGIYAVVDGKVVKLPDHTQFRLVSNGGAGFPPGQEMTDAQVRSFGFSGSTIQEVVSFLAGADLTDVLEELLAEGDVSAGASLADPEVVGKVVEKVFRDKFPGARAFDLRVGSKKKSLTKGRK